MKLSTPMKLRTLPVLLSVLIAPALLAQDTSTLPPAPSVVAIDSPVQSTSSSSSSDPQQTSEHTDGQTKRILGVIPNFRSVMSTEHLPPQTAGEKFKDATNDSFDYSAFVVPTFVASINFARNSYPEFGKGGVGFGRYEWHSLVDQTIENYMVEFIVPTIAHEDTRYYTLGHGGFLKRTGWSLGHVIVTRNDKGKNTFNSGEIVGAALGASLSNAYYPAQERSFSNTGQAWALNVGIDAFGYFIKEFWPDINHRLFHGKQ